MITDNVQIPHVSTRLSQTLITLEQQLIDQQVKIESWLRQQWQLTPPPLYGSVDLRNAGFKLAPVDTNLFPAGFNNLNRDFLPLCIQAMQAAIAEICPEVTRLLLVPENHTRNQMYFESIATLHEILIKSGFEVRIGSANPDIIDATDITTPSGQTLTLEPLVRQDNKVGVKDFFPCCVILNNDLSDGIPPELMDLDQQNVIPCTQLGWFARLKSEHFGFYEQVCHEFAQQLDIDPWLISPYFDYCNELDFMKQQGEGCLARRAEKLLYKIQQKYDHYGIEQKPYLVVKSNAGTYGMGVMVVQEAEQLLGLNRKQRTKMSSSKGNNPVTSAILQEGVYSFETWGEDKAVSEPVIYSIGRHVVGGFYRVHHGRGPDESLNAPGMNFEPLAFADVCNNPCGKDKPASMRFYVYGIIARLAMLAAAREMKAISQEQMHEH